MQIAENFNTIIFEQPLWLVVFAVLCIIALFIKRLSVTNLLSHLKFNYVYRHSYYPELSKLVANQAQSKTSLYRIFSLLLLFIVTGLLFVSLAGPYRDGQKLPEPPDNRNILFLVDNEVSMVLKDYFIDNERVDRLTMVKSVLLNFANKLSGNRMGLITFSENAYTLLPFTTDTNLIRKMIPRIESTLTGRSSNPQKALLYSLNYLHNLKLKNPDLKPGIVLITDVLRPPREIDPGAIAKYIHAQGYKLYVIAIGASSYKKEDIESSSLIYHPASFKRLKAIAESAGGDFYWAKNTDSLSDVIKDILQSGKSKIIVKPEYEKLVLFQWPLGLAMLLILLHFITDILWVRGNA